VKVSHGWTTSTSRMIESKEGPGGSGNRLLEREWIETPTTNARAAKNSRSTWSISGSSRSSEGLTVEIYGARWAVDVIYDECCF
jgi:hypothetical protein